MPIKTEQIQAGRPGARWALFDGEDIGRDGDPFIDRLRLIATPWFGIYVHKIHCGDIDPDPHDHPWWFASLILAGGYRELVCRDKHRPGVIALRTRGRWSVRTMSRRSAHRITSVDGPLWTLVLTGPRRSGWGFWTAEGFVPWREYVSKGQ